jgi:hypothetical protein
VLRDAKITGRPKRNDGCSIFIEVGKSWVFISANLKRPAKTIRDRLAYLRRRAKKADLDSGPVESGLKAKGEMKGLARVPEDPDLNDDKSPLIDLLSCFVCKETMKIEKSVPDSEGCDIIQYRCQGCARIELVRLFRRSR